jgi:hypothetical protein
VIKTIIGVKEYEGRDDFVRGSELFRVLSSLAKSLVEDFKLSTCGRQPSLFSLSFDLVCVFCFCFVMFFRKHVYYSSLGGAFFYVASDLCHPFRYCISGHIGDNLSF